MSKEDPKWNEIFITEAKGRAATLFSVTPGDEATQARRIAFAQQLQIPEILTHIVALANDTSSEEGLGMRTALIEMAGTSHISSFYSGHQGDMFVIYNPTPILALGFDSAREDSRGGALFIAKQLRRISAEKLIGYIKLKAKTPEAIAEGLAMIIFHPEVMTLSEAVNPKDCGSIVNEGNAVYMRFGKVFTTQYYKSAS